MLSLGPTVSEQAAYTVPAEVVEILYVEVDGKPYGHLRHQDPAEGALGWIWLGGTGGIAGRQDTAGGEQQLQIYPVPKPGGPLEPGKPLNVWAVCRPPDLLETDNTTLVIPGEYADALVGGAIATGLVRTEDRPDLAGAYEQMFTAACAELAQQSNRRFRGLGPAQIRVIGVNA
jgi:hypothetical protein